MSNLNLRGYGDLPNMKDDLLKIRDIFSRQGSSLIIDALAENVGEAANKFNLTVGERDGLVSSLSMELQNALSERL